MSKRAALPLAVAVLAAACSEPIVLDGSSNAALTIGAETLTIECKGQAKFTPEDGITDILVGDMESIAKKACGDEALGMKVNYETSSYANSKLPVMTSAKVEFTCPDAALPPASIQVKLPSLCQEAFERFGAQQSQ